MEEQKNLVTLSDEQLDALAQSLLPAMQEFFNSDRGKKIWTEHLAKESQGNESAA